MYIDKFVPHMVQVTKTHIAIFLQTSLLNYISSPKEVAKENLRMMYRCI